MQRFLRDGTKNAILYSILGIVGVLVVCAIGNISTLFDNQNALSNYVTAEKDANAYGAGDRVIHLPEDGQVWNLTIFTNSDWKSRSPDRDVVAWFQSDPRLMSLVAQTNYRHYTDNQAMYKLRFEKSIGGVLPAVVLQNESGYVVYKASGNNLPGSGSMLADDLANSIGDCPDCHPLRPKPEPKPTPSPNPPVNPAPKPNVPDIKPVNTPLGGDVDLSTLLIITIVVCGLLGYATEWKKEANS